jgi:hypothetical protein
MQVKSAGKLAENTLCIMSGIVTCIFKNVYLMLIRLAASAKNTYLKTITLFLPVWI